MKLKIFYIFVRVLMVLSLLSACSNANEPEREASDIPNCSEVELSENQLPHGGEYYVYQLQYSPSCADSVEIPAYGSVRLLTLTQHESVRLSRGSTNSRDGNVSVLTLSKPTHYEVKHYHEQEGVAVAIVIPSEYIPSDLRSPNAYELMGNLGITPPINEDRVVEPVQCPFKGQEVVLPSFQEGMTGHFPRTSNVEGFYIRFDLAYEADRECYEELTISTGEHDMLNFHILVFDLGEGDAVLGRGKNFSNTIFAGSTGFVALTEDVMRPKPAYNKYDSFISVVLVPEEVGKQFNTHGLDARGFALLAGIPVPNEIEIPGDEGCLSRLHLINMTTMDDRQSASIQLSYNAYDATVGCPANVVQFHGYGTDADNWVAGLVILEESSGELRHHPSPSGFAGTPLNGNMFTVSDLQPGAAQMVWLEDTETVTLNVLKLYYPLSQNLDGELVHFGDGQPDPEANLALFSSGD